MAASAGGLHALSAAPAVRATDLGPGPGPPHLASPELPSRSGGPGAAVRSAPLGAPATLALPGQDVTAPVVATGVDAHGELRVPDSPATVGWWAGSAPAGGTGTTLLTGHVDSATRGVGVLATLRDVRLGSPVVLTDTAGARHPYAVTARRTYPKYALPRSVFTAAPLVLITCGGPFDRATGHYRDNIVVYATPA